MFRFNKKLFFLLIGYSFIHSAVINSSALANNEQYPNISGKVFFEFEADRIISANKQGISTNDAHINIEPFMSLNLNPNWSVATHWRFDTMEHETRSNVNSERVRSFLSSDREFHFNDQGLIIEEIKGQFENEDLRFFFGKFNPSFGTAFRNEKRIGVFSTDFTRDYELTEKIGLGLSALFENSKLTVNSFFNDTTGLSNSAFKKRGREKNSSGLAGNTSTLSSYSITLEGTNLGGLDDLFYNIGYERQEVENIAGRNAEEGFVVGAEYLFPIGYNVSLIPFAEVAQINNLSGEQNRDVLYLTTALILRQGDWNLSVAHIMRDIDQNTGIGNVLDEILQYSVGYKFANNVAIDVSRINLKEDGNEAVMVGILLSYIYEF